MLKGEKNIQLHDLATTGGLSIEDAFRRVYSPKDKKTLQTLLAAKRKRQPELFKLINDFKDQLFGKAAKAQEDIIEKHAGIAVRTAIEKREALARIITGAIETKELIVVNKKLKRVTRKPSLAEMMRAIELDNKMAGHFAADGIEIGVGPSFMDFIKEVNSTIDNGDPNSDNGN